MMNQKKKFAMIGTCALGVLGLACSTPPPAKSYVDARNTYAKAEEGPAKEFAPDELLEARQMLEKAEDAKNGSAEQKHWGYLADRQARLATSSGSIEHYQSEKLSAQAKYIERIESDRSNAQEELEDTREQLSQVETNLKEKDANVEELSARKAELEKKRSMLESELNQKNAALSESEQARAEAEKRAAAAIASLNELANVKEEANETVITLSGAVLFKTGKAELLPLAENKLDQVAEALKQLDDEKQIVIEGHTDARGANEMNKKLSQSRADSVLKYLASQGVDEKRMKAVGRGEEAPIAENDSPEGRANNRRVELRITEEPRNSSASTQKVSDEGSS